MGAEHLVVRRLRNAVRVGGGERDLLRRSRELHRERMVGPEQSHHVGSIDCKSGQLALVGHTPRHRQRLTADEPAHRLEEGCARLLDRVDDGARDDSAGACEGQRNVEVDQWPRGVAECEVEGAVAVEADHAREVARGIEADRLAVDGEVPAGARAGDGAADDRGPVQNGHRAEREQLRDGAWPGAPCERERRGERSEQCAESDRSVGAGRHGRSTSWVDCGLVA